MSEHLQKFLANLGLGSRRQIETWIREQRLTSGLTRSALQATVLCE